MSQVNPFLADLFRAHGVASDPGGEWIAFPNRHLKANAAIVREWPQPTGMSVQLDVRLEIAPWQTIIESFAGVGENRDTAVADALHNFTANSLHVLLAAFFDANQDQVAQEEWLIGGRNSQVTLGNIGIRGQPPAQAEPLVGWFKAFEEKLKEQQLEPGTHWVRLYYGQLQDKAIACEVLLDNEVWGPLQSAMAAFAWPSGQEFYSVRVFLVIQAENGDPFTPASAVAQLAAILAANPELSEVEVYEALAKAGVSDALAKRAYPFTQIAWGRKLLEKLAVGFSSEYLCFDADGRVVESGRLQDEPCFAAATRLSQRYAGTPAFRNMALTAADVHAVNNLLHAGSKPENLILGPPFVFVKPPTPAGLKNAQQMISERLASISKARGSPKTGEAAGAPTKPWWRFWS